MGEPAPDGLDLPGLSFNDQVIRRSTDGKAIIVGGATAQTVDRVDPVTGRREPLVTLGNQPPVAGGASSSSRWRTTRTSFFTVDGVR
jgi:hypothetical protein